MRGPRLAPRHPRRAALWLAILGLAACQGPPESPPSVPPDAAPAPDLSPPAAAASRIPAEREFCQVLAGVLAAEPDGFARLRAARVADDRWLGREKLPGIGRCTIEGEAWPRARYACVSEPFQIYNRAGARASFAALTDDNALCLSKPIWFPREWQKGEPFEFAMGERLQTWTDQSTAPPSQVVLKVQRDIDHHGYRLKLDLEAVR